MGTPACLALGAILSALALSASVGCRGAQDAKTPPSPAVVATAVPIEDRLGWLHASCFAIANATLAADAPVAVVSLGDVPSVIDARIVRMTTSSDTCPALLEDRRRANVAQGMSFYEVRVPTGTSLELGIGVIGDATRLGGGLDVSGDGVADQFTECATSEGVSFAVWNGAPYHGTPLWSAYYYLGYDTDVTCPANEPTPSRQ